MIIIVLASKEIIDQRNIPYAYSTCKCMDKFIYVC